MVYDTFLFFNELELLEIRLNELDSVVDKFVLVEATVTHTNKPKPLYYKLNKDKFRKFHKKIIHVVVKDSPDVNMPWIIERYQLSAVTRGLKDCKPNDTILYSCVDTIPKAEKVKEWINMPGKLKSFKQTLCLYFLNCVKYGVGSGYDTRMFRYKDLKYFKDIYLTIFLRPDVEIADGGWHFSYMGGIKRIQKKLASFAHQELNNSKYNTPEKIMRAITEGKDPFDLGWKLHIVNIHFLPEHVVKNPSRFKHMLATKSKTHGVVTKLRMLILETKHMARVNFLRKLRIKLNGRISSS